MSPFVRIRVKSNVQVVCKVVLNQTPLGLEAEELLTGISLGGVHHADRPFLIATYKGNELFPWLPMDALHAFEHGELMQKQAFVGGSGH